jgi:epoxide hydrolase-like predicted phosphatase
VTWRAVIFDLGGVVLPSPINTFRAYEAEHGLPHRFLSEVVLGGGDHGAWSRFERGELDGAGFVAAFGTECETAGGVVDVAELLAEITGGGGPHPVMLDALRRIRAEGLRTAALTNNWALDDRVPMGERHPDLGALFDVIVESAVEGIRKPDRRIYELVCARLDVRPEEAVFLDDLGVNLKPARALGMATIKVETPEAALDELARVLGFPLSVDGEGPDAPSATGR